MAKRDHSQRMPVGLPVTVQPIVNVAGTRVGVQVLNSSAVANQLPIVVRQPHCIGSAGIQSFSSHPARAASASVNKQV